MSKYLNVYKVDQGYGGAEEGGWWYDYGVPHASIPVRWEEKFGDARDHDEGVYTHESGPEDLDTVRARWNAWCNAKNDANPHYTNTNGVGEYRVSIESHPAEPWPKERPRYE
tara:strand:+ start:1802 stop:2137 length:336 start_codon:yes stop_codon:yes gene_type:complete